MFVTIDTHYGVIKVTESEKFIYDDIVHDDMFNVYNAILPDCSYDRFLEWSSVSVNGIKVNYYTNMPRYSNIYGEAIRMYLAVQDIHDLKDRVASLEEKIDLLISKMDNMLSRD